LARQIHQEAGLPFVEVYMDTPTEVCAMRDPKGLYAKASAGSLGSFTGIDDPYEIPQNPELAIEPSVPVEAAVDFILAALDRAGN
jgi:bifunctional enzyme CysN/CysC